MLNAKCLNLRSEMSGQRKNFSCTVFMLQQYNQGATGYVSLLKTGGTQSIWVLGFIHYCIFICKCIVLKIWGICTTSTLGLGFWNPLSCASASWYLSVYNIYGMKIGDMYSNAVRPLIVDAATILFNRHQDGS